MEGWDILESALTGSWTRAAGVRGESVTTLPPASWWWYTVWQIISLSAAQNSGIIICLHRCVTCRRSQHSDNILKVNCLVVRSGYFCSCLLRLIFCLTLLLILFSCLSRSDIFYRDIPGLLIIMKWGWFNAYVKVEQMNAYLSQTLTRSIQIKLERRWVHPGQYRR